MRKGPPLFHLFLCILALHAGFLPTANAQTAGTIGSPEQPDSTFQSSLTAAIIVYTHSPAADAGLYNGTIYPGYDHHAQGHPFFLSDSLLPGSVCYAGVLYPDISLSYDLVRNIVVMPDRRKTLLFQLLTGQIRYFTLAQHRFIHLTPDSNAANAPAAGFYEELYKGKATALAHHEKTLQNTGKAEENLSRYQQYDTWYLEIKDRYYTVRNNNSLLEAFGAEKGRIRDLLRKNHIRFKKDPASALIKAAEYYGQ
jgi:hypothetical protein